MVCPSCQLTDIADDEKICPRCGEVLTGRPTLSAIELDNIREKSILRGKIAELESREKTYKSKVSQLRTYLILLLLLMPFTHYLCNQRPLPSINDWSSELEARFAREQLTFNQLAIQELLAEQPTFLYITNYGDTPEGLSRAFYETRAFADTIVADNYIYNDRQIPTGDTLILRKNPAQRLSNILELKALQKNKLIQGDKKVLMTFPDAVN